MLVEELFNSSSGRFTCSGFISISFSVPTGSHQIRVVIRLRTTVVYTRVGVGSSNGKCSLLLVLATAQYTSCSSSFPFSSSFPLSPFFFTVAPAAGLHRHPWLLATRRRTAPPATCPVTPPHPSLIATGACRARPRHRHCPPWLFHHPASGAIAADLAAHNPQPLPGMPSP
jgi:hypothetical protein